jgi:hypothetical protein
MMLVYAIPASPNAGPPRRPPKFGAWTLSESNVPNVVSRFIPPAEGKNDNDSPIFYNLDQMTWVIAANVPLLGYAIAISDIRVTFGALDARQERDCLQKIYPVGQDLVAGFAGAVEIGFEMVESLQKGLHLDDPSLSWDPTVIAEQWPITARKIFQKYPAVTQQHGCQIILLGAHPVEHVGIPGIGRTYVYSFSCPNFEPVQAKPYEVLSIGSGSGVPPYLKVLERYTKDPKFRKLLMRGESMPGGMATMLGSSVTTVIKQNPEPGISQHLHLCTVKRGAVQIWPNDHSHTGRWEMYSLGPPDKTNDKHPETNNFTMPPVVTTYKELCSLLDDASGAMGNFCCLCQAGCRRFDLGFPRACCTGP